MTAWIRATLEPAWSQFSVFHRTDINNRIWSGNQSPNSGLVLFKAIKGADPRQTHREWQGLGAVGEVG